MSASGFFSPTYAAARQRFLDLCTRHDLTVEHHPHPHALGPDGEALVLDCAIAGDPQAECVLLIQSATHGAEGFCGAGLQVGFLDTGLVNEIPQGLKVILVHALNPFGFAWLRRVNEDNVDLNRNFLDHGGPYPDNPGYEALKDAIALTALTPEATQAAAAHMRAFAQAHGRDALQAAISAGQYTHAEGLYYGGRAPAWSNGVFRHIVGTHAGHATRAALIDVHTGLGPYGVGELILEVGPDDPAYARARDWWGKTVTSTEAGDSVSAKLSGTIDLVLPAMLPHAETVSAALEFGTYPPVEVFQATRADNWLHHYGDPLGPDAGAIKAEVRRVFYPDTDDWKAMVWEQFAATVRQAARGLTQG